MPFYSTAGGNQHLETSGRGKFVRDFCDTCLQPGWLDGCGSTFRSILEVVRCPEELAETHAICRYCLDLRPQLQKHDDYCVFARERLQLRAGGWSTPVSNSILRSMRQVHFSYEKPVTNLLRILLQEIDINNALLIPIPLGRTDRWLDIVRAASASIEGMEVLPALRRKKHQSTRRSVAQVRESIAWQEYEADPTLSSRVSGRAVILLDDNVTTGNTIASCASLLRRFEPMEILPLAIERHVSVRVLQRCASPLVETCSYYQPKNDKE